MQRQLPYIPLNFDEKNHRYYDDSNRDYISVTTLIQKEFPFDSEKIAEKVIVLPYSKYYGMTKEEVLKKWEDSAPAGTEVHNAVESFIKQEQDICPQHILPLIKQFSKLRFNGYLWSEVILHDEEYQLAGMADIIEETEECCYLYDIKTSVLSPKGILAEDKRKKFTLQLNFYRFMIERKFKKRCEIIGIFWFANYVNLKEQTKLRFVRIYNDHECIKGLLHKRKIELMSS